MAALAESVWGVVIFLIYPSFLFAALAAYSLRVLQSRAPPVMVHKVILASNAAIMSSLVVLYAVGGGVFGFLLPDMRRKIKFFNYASLAASSSAIDLLMGLFIGAALQQKKSEATLPEATQPEATQPSRVGKACFAFLVALDLFTGLSLGTTWFPVMVTEEVLPGLLIVAELVCSAFLTWRCRALQVRVALLAQDAPAAKHTLKNLHIRLVVAGVSSSRAALAIPPTHQSLPLARPLARSLPRLGAHSTRVHHSTCLPQARSWPPAPSSPTQSSRLRAAPGTSRPL